MSSSSAVPVAAQTDPSATRSFDPTTVAPGGMVTVSIDVEGVGQAGSVTERMPADFTYVSTTALSLNSNTLDGSTRVLVFPFLASGGSASFTYTLTAPSAEADYSFSGKLNPGDVDVEGAGSVEVATAPAVTGPEPEDNDLEFDVVSSKAVKGAQVSGVGNPIDSNPLTWAFDTDVTLADGAGDLGDFEVKSTGDNEFGLFVKNSGATPTGGSQRISVVVTSTNDDGDEVTSELRGTITSQGALAITNAGPFTIPQGISAGTLVGDFDVSGGISGEYLDGILTGSGSDMFSVDDDDMTIMYKGGSLSVGTYSLSLTVSGDAGLANRTAIMPVSIIVTASNMAPTVPATFAATINENNDATGTLVDAGTEVGDASAGVSANDSDTLTYALAGAGASHFQINSSSGMITVGTAIADGGAGDYNFQITVSDGITANEQTISATVSVVGNSPVALAGAASDGTLSLSETVNAADNMPLELVDLQSLVSDADGNTVTFSVSGNPSHIVHSVDDKLLLTYLPTQPQADPTVSTVTVSASDGWNDDPDATITVTVSVTVEARPAITSNFVDIEVAEGSTSCVRVMSDGTEARLLGSGRSN